MRKNSLKKPETIGTNILAFGIAAITFMLYLLISVPYIFYRAWKKANSEYHKSKSETYPVNHVS
jgi:hypothetical protein